MLTAARSRNPPPAERPGGFVGLDDPSSMIQPRERTRARCLEIARAQLMRNRRAQCQTGFIAFI